MKNRVYKFAYLAVLNIAILSITSSPLLGQFQKAYGTAFDNSFSKVIKDGTNYYVLGQDESIDGSPMRATVTRLDVNGVHEWTISLNTGSIWNDAVRTPAGDLMVVGSTWPLNASNKSLIGLISPSGGGFTWVRSYDTPGMESFNRVVKNPVPQNAAFPYYILGSQNQSGASETTDDVIVLNLDASGTFNWKKIYLGDGDDEFSHELEALPNGDLMLGGNDFSGEIFTTDNALNQISGIQISGISFVDILQESNGGFYAAANSLVPGDFPHIVKMDFELLVLWEAGLPQLTSVSQVWEGSQGAIYVTGRGVFGGINRGVIVKLSGNPIPDVEWVKYFNTGTSFTGGSSWLMPNGQLAFTDGRMIPGGFGQFCAFISLSDIDLNACGVTESFTDLVYFDPIPNGPVAPPVEFYDVPTGVNLMSEVLDWQQSDVCAEDTCVADFIFENQNDCGQIIFTNLSSGSMGLSYCWDFDGNPNTCESTAANPIWQFPLPACQDWNICLTITDVDGCSATKCQQVSISDTGLPIMTCPADIVLDCTDSTLPANTGTAIAADNCTFNPMVTYTDIFTMFNCSTTIIRTWKASDDCNNFVTCVQTITVLDLNPPQIINCPQNITVQGTVGSNGQCSADVVMAVPVVQDNCDPSVSLLNSFNQSTNASGFYPVGSTIVTWTATDDCNNTATCTTEVLVNCPITQENCCLEWAFKIGHNGDDQGIVIDIDASGNTIIGGSFQGTIDFDPGPGIFNLTSVGSNDAYVAKFDPSGNFLWAISFGGGGYDIVNDLTIDLFGNIILSGGFAGSADFDPSAGNYILNSIGTSSLFLSKLSSTGGFIYAFPVGGTMHILTTYLVTDALRNIYMTGLFQSTADFDPGPSNSNLTAFGIRDAFIVKYSSGGAFIRAGQMGGPSSSILEIGGIDIDGSGNIVAVGIFTGTIDFDPSTSVSSLTTNQVSDIYLVKWDANGSFVWAKSFFKTSGTYDNHILDIVLDNQGNIFTTGSFAGSADFDPGPGTFILTSGGNIPGSSFDVFTANLDPNGQLIWVKTIEGVSGDTGLGVDFDAQGNVYTVGFFTGASDFDPGPGIHSITPVGNATFFLKLNSTGDFVWAKSVDGFICLGKDIKIDAAGSIFSTGYFYATTDFDPGTNVHLLSSTGISGHDAFVMKIGTCLPAPCECQGFSQMYFNGLPVGNISVSCNGNIENLGCPLPGTSLSLTGNFQCKNNDCPATPDLEWELEGPNGGVLTHGTISSSIAFALSIASSNFTQGGVYTIRLTGHCGSEMCNCFVSFFIEDGCQPTCPCDQNDFLAAVRRGFATTYSLNNCNICFTPLSLGDCDEVNWFIDSPNGSPIGTTSGTDNFCLTMTPGLHDIFMIVSRKNSVGLICGTETFTQGITVTCAARPDCNYSAFGNPEFDQGSVEGSLLPDSSGMTDGWIAHWGDPHVDQKDGTRWDIILDGNSGYNDVVGTSEPICLEKSKGTITLRFGIRNQGIKSTLAIQIFTDDVFNFGDCSSSTCFEIGRVELVATEANSQYEIEIPYDLSLWIPEQTCNEFGVPVRVAIFVSNLLNDVQGISTRTEVLLDNFCTEGTIVATENPQGINQVNFFPNPARDIFYIRTEHKIDDIKVVNVNGQDVAIKVSGNGGSELDISSLSAGIYYVFIRTGDQVTNSKFVKF